MLDTYSADVYSIHAVQHTRNSAAAYSNQYNTLETVQMLTVFSTLEIVQMLTVFSTLEIVQMLTAISTTH